MVIESNRWIRNGIVISIESVKLLFANPILFVYALVPLAMVLIWQVLVGAPVFLPAENLDNAVAPLNTSAGLYVIFTWICFIVGTFFACCLAHHTMRILRQQPASVRESFAWCSQHSKQIGAWILIELFLSFGWLTLFPQSTHMLLTIGAIVAALFLLGFLSFILLLFKLHIVIPIISTEPIEIIPAIKRSSLVIWHNLGTYIVMLFSSAIIAVMLYAIPATLIGLLVGVQPFVHSVWNAQLVLLLSLPIFTIANTLFYYEFYVKRELEMHEIFFTSQI